MSDPTPVPTISSRDELGAYLATGFPGSRGALTSLVRSLAKSSADELEVVATQINEELAELETKKERQSVARTIGAVFNRESKREGWESAHLLAARSIKGQGYRLKVEVVIEATTSGVTDWRAIALGLAAEVARTAEAVAAASNVKDAQKEVSKLCHYMTMSVPLR